jgi:hypothetical protein
VIRIRGPGSERASLEKSLFGKRVGWGRERWEVLPVPRVVEIYQELCVLQHSVNRPLHLYFFGYSRGAYVASVASQGVHYMGLVKNSEGFVGDPLDL